MEMDSTNFSGHVDRLAEGSTATEDRPRFGQSDQHLPLQPPRVIKSAQGTLDPRTGRACDACSTERMRCEGGVPCLRCTSRNLECKFDRLARSHSLAREREVSPIRSQVSQDPIPGVPSPSPLGLGFTHSQLSLALNLQKAKPAGLSTRDYCLQLRKHIKTRMTPAVGEHRYIDTAEFWKDQFTKLNTEKRALEVQVARLELLIQSSSEKVSLRSHLEIPKDRVSLKRKAPAAEDVDLEESTADLRDDTEDEVEPANCLPLLTKSHDLYRLIQDNQVTSDKLLTAILSTISYSTTLVEETCRTVTLEPNYLAKFCSEKVTQSLKIAAAVFNMCLRGLAHLCRDIIGRRSKGHVIYALVRFFTSALESLHQLCSVQVSCRPDIRHIYPIHTNLCAGPQKNLRISRVITELSRMLGNIFTAPEFQKSSLYYSEVLEGLFSALLNQIGGLISEAIFTGSLASCKRRARIISPSHNSVPTEVRTLMVQLEGKNLALVLKRAVTDRSLNGPLKLASILTRSYVSMTDTKKEFILVKARICLQKTLLKGIFGEDDGEFREALKLPTVAEEEPTMEPAADGPQKPVDFVETVWSIVGWETFLS